MGKKQGNRPVLVIVLLLFLIMPIRVTPVTLAESTSEEKNQTLQFQSSSSNHLGYSLHITDIGLRSDFRDNITLSNGLYQIQSDFAFTTIFVKFNFTGLANWNLGAQSHFYNNNSINFGNTSATLGQFFLIGNGDIYRIQSPDILQAGVSLSLPYGDHTIVVLYINYDDDEKIQYATDSIFVRLRKTVGELDDPVELIKMEMTLQRESIDASAQEIQMVRWVQGRSGNFYDRRDVYRVDVKTVVQIEGSILQEDDFVIDSGKSHMTMTSKINSSDGIGGFQTNYLVRNVEGMEFVLDAKGIHPVSEGVTTYEVTLRDGRNYLGMISLSPAGMIHQNITYPVGFDTAIPTPGIIDWDTNLDHVNDSNDNSIEIDSSFDYLGGIDSISFLFHIDQNDNSTQSGLNDSLFGFGAIFGIVITLVRRRERK